MRFIVVIFSVLIFGTSVLPLSADDFGTRDEAVAMVRRVQEKFRKEGAEATFRAINSAAPGFVDRDLYPFVHKIDGTQVVAMPSCPCSAGKTCTI